MVGQGGDAAGSVRRRRHAVARALADTAAIGLPFSEPKNVLTPLERCAVSAAAQAAATAQDSLAPLFANLGAAVQPAICRRNCSGDRTGAGATDQPRSKSRRRRHQDRVSEIRNFPRGFAGGGLGPVERRSRSQGRADRAAPGPAIGARRNAAPRRRRRRATEAPQSQADSRPAPSASPDPTSRKSCCRRRAAGRGRPRAGRPRPPAARLPPRSTPGLRPARPQPVAGSAAGAGNPRAQSRCRKTLRGASDLSYQHAAAAVPRRASGGAADRGAAIAPDGPLATTAHHLLDDTDAAHRAADPAAGGLACRPYRQFGAEGRHECAALEFRDSVCDAAGHGDGAVRDFARRRGAEVEAAKRVWRARFSLDVEPAGPVHALVSLRATRPRCGCGRNGLRRRSNCAPAPPN